MPKLPPAILSPAKWNNLTRLHGTKKRLWLITSGGISTAGQGITYSQPLRFIGLASSTFMRFSGTFHRAAATFGINIHTLIATACAESGGFERAFRQEPDGRKSYGLCQLLTTTAYTVGRAIGWPRVEDHCKEPLEWFMPRSGRKDFIHWHIFLTNPVVNINLAAAYYMLQAKRYPHINKDPIALYATYNAGGLYDSDNDWGLHSTKNALYGFRNFYNDSVKDNARKIW